jgi:hypothetical protein
VGWGGLIAVVTNIVGAVGIVVLLIALACVTRTSAASDLVQQ